jgi:rod shape-determining protein MreC
MHKIEDFLAASLRDRSLQVLLICVAISVVLMTKYQSGPWLSSPRASIDRTIGQLTGRMGWFARLVWLAEEYRTLYSQIADRTVELERLEELRRENERLRRELGFSPKSEWEFLHAEVVGKETGRLGTVILVNQGSLAGVGTGWIAYSPQGLVGKVEAVGDEFSRVQLITNYNSPVGVRIERNEIEAVVEWNPYLPNRLVMRFIQPEIDVKAGDVVISSGLGGVYPAGLRIGRVSKVTLEKGRWEPYVEVKPFVDFSRLVEILLIAPERVKVEMREGGLFNPAVD